MKLQICRAGAGYCLTVALLALMPLSSQAQRKVVLEIEKLSKPEKLLGLTPVKKIYENMIISGSGIESYERDDFKDFRPDIVAFSDRNGQLVDMGAHAFFNGMFQAYADHRPFVLSPDMMWLLIAQGFARHVNSDPEHYRKYFTNRSGKTNLVVENKNIRLDDPDSPWEEVFPEFTAQINGFSGKELKNMATSNFSTTDATAKLASEVTLMEAVKSYFEFVVIYVGCGIPEITLEGTTDDWKKVLQKARYLKKYELDWWISEIEPLLQQFVNASEGKTDKQFWMNMFKYHTLEKYGKPKVIDGWIVKFFPYDKTGKRNGLKEIHSGSGNLPSEMVKVDMTYIAIDNKETKTTPLEIWAGFTGLEQNPKTFALRPKIGWMIRKNDGENNPIAKKLKLLDTTQFNGGIMVRVKSVPKEILDLREVRALDIYFVDEIDIPEEMGRMKIGRLNMRGKISQPGIDRILKLLPNTRITINNNTYNNEL